MPVSKGRKPKRPGQPTATKTKLPPPPPPRGWWSRWWGWLVTALGVVSAIVGLLVLLPAVTIEPSNAPDASNPFSGVFKVTNGQIYPIEHVHVQAFLWCTKVGTGTDTTPPSMCEKSNIPSSMTAWNQNISPHGSRQINAGEVLSVTGHALLYAEISIKVSYQSWFLPIPLEREDHFYTRRKDNGDIEWLSK